MIFIALLRGINVGGKNLINMKELKISFEKSGMCNVKTYINSGNIIFTHQDKKSRELTLLLEETILKTFNLSIKVLIRDFFQIEEIMTSLPEHWVNDGAMKSNVIFLWNEIDNPDIMEKLILKPGIDIAFYIPGTLLWSIPKEQTSKSGLMTLTSSPLYKKMTIRNVNTLRKVYGLMKDLL